MNGGVPCCGSPMESLISFMPAGGFTPANN